MTLALDYGKKKRAERQRPEEPDVDPQVRFCERGRSRERSLLDPVVEHRDTTGKAPPKKDCTPEVCCLSGAPSGPHSCRPSTGGIALRALPPAIRRRAFGAHLAWGRLRAGFFSQTQRPL